MGQSSASLTGLPGFALRHPFRASIAAGLVLSGWTRLVSGLTAVQSALAGVTVGIVVLIMWYPKKGLLSRRYFDPPAPTEE
jgi:hypothetical protein